MTYKDVKFTSAIQVTVEDAERLERLMETYNLTWEDFGEAVLQGVANEVFGQDEYGMDTMYIYKIVTGSRHYFDAAVDSDLFMEVARIRFEVHSPYTVKVEFK